ncbi:MAG: nuclear transport factor 2 family protein [Acidimicrobiales bacterium]|nr:nuclear transport factor 2 family protein [Acidimicrobiales bacterium]
MTESVEQQLTALTERVTRVEDELAIHRLIVRYALAVDAGEAEAAMALFTEDTVYEVGNVGTGMDGETTRRLVMPGREAVGRMVRSDAHQALLPDAAHTAGPVVVDVDGDHATATGYTRIYHRRGDEEFVLFRLSVNHYECVREDGEWLISRRVSEVIGSEDVQDLMRLGLR